MHGRLSLQQRLVVLVMAAILPLSALSVWHAVRDVHLATLQAQAQLKLAASLVAANQDRMIEGAQQMMAAIAAQPGLDAADNATCVRYFAGLRSQLQIYANIGLFDLQGKSACHALAVRGTLSVANPQQFSRVIAEKRFAVGAPRTAQIGAGPVLPLLLPLIEGGQVRAVAFAALDLSRASAVLALPELPPGASLAVTDRRGQVVAEYPARPQAPLGRRLLGGPVPWSGDERSGTGEFEQHGQVTLFAYASSRAAADGSFIAVVMQDQAAVAGALWAGLRRQLLVLAMTMLAGMAAAWWLGGRFIVRPAKRILGAVRRLEQGRLDARVPLASALGESEHGEFGRIATAFNLMAESLQMRQRELQAELGHSLAAYGQLDLVTNSMQEGLIAVNPLGQFLMFNRAATRVFALEHAKVLLELWPLYFGIHEPDGKHLLAARDLPLARAIRGESGSCLVYVRNAVVSEGRMLQCSFQPMHGEGGICGGLMVFSDVTEHRRVQAELLLLRNPLARLNDIVLITEAEPVARPGPRIVFVNQTFERLMGYSPQEAIGNTPRMLQGPRTDRATLDRIRAALERWQPVREELVNYTRDGREVWVELDIVPLADDHGGYSHWISVQRDITGRRQAEQALKASEQALQAYNASLESRIEQRTAELARQERLFRALAEQAPAVVWNTDPEGNATYINRALYELVGGQPGQWLGLAWLQCMHPDDAPALREKWRRARQTLEPYSGIRRILDRDGRYHTMAYQSAPVLDEQGKIAFWVGVDADITSQKAIEQALRDSNQELEAFSYSVSHDLRAPLSAIGGFSRALGNKLEGQLDERSRHYLARIQAGVEKMEELIDALLSLAKLVQAPVSYATVDLSALARGAMDELQMAWPARSLEAVVQEGLVAQGDPRLLRLVLDNLLGNAWKFTSQQPQARIEVGQQDGGKAFFVRDNGVGFDMAYAGKLFSPFQRLHSESDFAGTGIGLATVQRIVARHQGRVWAESVPGEGACFFFTLAETAQPWPPG